MARSSTIWLVVALATASVAGCAQRRAPVGVASAGPAAPSVAPLAAPRLTSADVDAQLREAWGAQGIVPAPRADDATWLRRVSLDLLGVIPAPAAVEAFLADASPDKRTRAVRALLDDPRHAEAESHRWERILLGDQARA